MTNKNKIKITEFYKVPNSTFMKLFNTQGKERKKGQKEGTRKEKSI